MPLTAHRTIATVISRPCPPARAGIAVSTARYKCANGTGWWMPALRGHDSAYGQSAVHRWLYLSPNQAVAMARKEKNPTTAVIVVTKGPDDTAGSTPSLIRISGTRIPPSA